MERTDDSIIQPSDGTTTGSFWGAVRRQWRVVALVTGLSVAAALLWTVLSSPEYKATATLLAAPLPATNESFVGIDLLRESADGTRTLQTAAALLDTRAAAERTAGKLGGDWTTKDVQDAVSVEPQGQTNIVDVTGTDTSAAGAALLANTYVDAALELRRTRLTQQAGAAADDVRSHLKTLPAGSSAAAELEARLPQLEAVRAGTDPTLGVGQVAAPPDNRSGTPTAVTIVLSALLGLIAGIAIAVWLDSTARRGATEDELLAAYTIPLLAQVPPGRKDTGSDRSPGPSPAASEAYRSVLTQLRRDERSTLLVTSAGGGEGKSQTAVGLAQVAAASGLNVALIDLDLRRPAVTSLLGMPAESRVDPADLGTPGSGLAALANAPGSPGLSVLALADGPLTSLRLETGLRNVTAVLDEVARFVDLVVVDTAPLGEVSDALRVIPQADDVVVVASPNRTELEAFKRMRNLLERSGHAADGVVMVEEPAAPAAGSHSQGQPRSRHRPASEPATQ